MENICTLMEEKVQTARFIFKVEMGEIWIRKNICVKASNTHLSVDYFIEMTCVTAERSSHL